MCRSALWLWSQELRDNAECPSLSPDGLRLAYKKRVSDGVYPTWRFYLLDLTKNTESALAETRNVDDQIAWLDNDMVMYAVPREGSEEKINDIWSLNIKGGEPQLVIEGGESPTVATYPTALVTQTRCELVAACPCPAGSDVGGALLRQLQRCDFVREVNRMGLGQGL